MIIEDTDPYEIVAGELFNPWNGEAAIAITGENFIDGSTIFINNLALPTVYGSKEFVTASVPKNLYQYPGELEIVLKLLDKNNEVVLESNRVAIQVKKQKEAIQATVNRNEESIKEYSALIGEFAWHSFTVDPRIENDSKEHYEKVMQIINKYGLIGKKPLRILEVAAYANTAGYRLKKELSAEVTLFDISASTLRLGHHLSGISPDDPCPTLVAGDFHSLPFEDESFDFVFISAALHHTWRYQTVGRELQRVVTSNGLLYIMGEPCLREACFYKFRANRPSYTPMEQKLSDLGILTFVTEQFTGSRPEYLYGMIENKQMPLQSLLDLFNESCDLLEIKLDRQYCMGQLENEWVNNRKMEINNLNEKIICDLKTRLEDVSHSYNTVEKGLGFRLPDDDEIVRMGESIAIKLHQLDEHNEFDYQKALSELFGAGLQIVARKKRSKGLKFFLQGICSYILKGKNSKRCHSNKGLFNNNYPIIDHVRYAYPEKISNFLIQNKSIIPEFLSKNKTYLEKIFPDDDWKYDNFENCDTLHHDRISLQMINKRAKIIIPLQDVGEILVMLRIYVNSGREWGGHYRILIKHKDEIRFVYNVFQSEACLYADIIKCHENKNLDLIIETESLYENHISDESQKAFPCVVCYAGAFVIS